jgi:hypothetical protein
VVEHDEELETLALKIADFVRHGMGSRSKWALRAALDAAETEGVAGVLALKIPSKGKDQPDVMFCVGSVDLVQRWGS